MHQLHSVHDSQLRVLTCVQDPGNLEADLQAGGFAGYALLWLFVVCTIMVSAAFEGFKHEGIAVHRYDFRYSNTAAAQGSYSIQQSANDQEVA